MPDNNDTIDLSGYYSDIDQPEILRCDDTTSIDISKYIPDAGSTREKLTSIIGMELSSDDRVNVSFTRTGVTKSDDMERYVKIVAKIEKCTIPRALLSVTSIGATVLYFMEKEHIDKDIYEECDSLIVDTLMSRNDFADMITRKIIDKDVYMIIGKRWRIWMPSDVAGFVLGFSDRYYVNSRSVFTGCFWLGLDQLARNEDMYSGLHESDEFNYQVGIIKGVIGKINSFNASVINLNATQLLFGD